MALERLSLGGNVVEGETNCVTDGGGETRPPSTAIEGGDDGVKTSRLPRWTRQEILVLIQGKRVAESKIRRGRAAGMAFGLGHVEPKWASVSSYCKRHGVNRGPVQCRKRWSNLAGDFKKIKEWESSVKDETESFWAMRNDLRRERKLPGFFDREVYDILDGGAGPPSSAEPALALALAPATTSTAEKSEAVFDSGRSAADEDGLFSDFEHEEAAAVKEPRSIADPVPISVSGKQYQPCSTSNQAQGTTNGKQPMSSNPETGSTSRDQRKRKRETAEREDRRNGLQNHLIDILERNGKILSAQLEAQNSNIEIDREQRQDHANSLVSVLNKLADALGRIADKL